MMVTLAASMLVPIWNMRQFKDLQNPDEFMKVTNGEYFVEWDCKADLSADTIEALWQVAEQVSPIAV